MVSAHEKNRMLHFDLLRIIAAFSVVMLHSAAQFWYDLPVTGMEWKIANTYDALFRFGVPIFVMISGALFLDREVNIKRLYTHNILRLLVLYLVWSVIYGLYDCRDYTLAEVGWIVYRLEIFGGRYHLWFLKMIVAIYMLLPILRTWVKAAKKEELEYLLKLFFMIKVVIGTIGCVWDNGTFAYFAGLFDTSTLSMACNYIAYFVLGYYITHYSFSAKWKKFIYAMMLPSAILNIVIDTQMALKAGAPAGAVYDSFGLFTFIIVIGLFLFFHETMSKVNYGKKLSLVIREVSACTLGVYLMHILALEYLETQGIHTMTLPIVWGIPVMAIGVFVGCILVSAVLRRIPFVGKYIC